MNSTSYTSPEDAEQVPPQDPEAGASPGEAATRKKGGLIEEVLRRGKARRELVVWEGAKVKPSTEVLLAHDPFHPHSERLRSLRTEILMRSGAGSSAMFAVLSADKGAGRSRLCAELAIAFAQLGGKTLLVDADLRHPRQHELFDAENDSGLSQALASSRAAVFHRVEGVPHLALITSGSPPPNPLELLCSIQFQNLVSEWQRTFQYVILDSPAAAGCSDAQAIAAAVGQAVVVGRTKITPLNDVKALLEKIQTSNTQVIGAVMNSF